MAAAGPAARLDARRPRAPRRRALLPLPERLDRRARAPAGRDADGRVPRARRRGRARRVRVAARALHPLRPGDSQPVAGRPAVRRRAADGAPALAVRLHPGDDRHPPRRGRAPGGPRPLLRRRHQQPARAPAPGAREAGQGRGEDRSAAGRGRHGLPRPAAPAARDRRLFGVRLRRVRRRGSRRRRPFRGGRGGAGLPRRAARRRAVVRLGRRQGRLLAGAGGPHRRLVARPRPRRPLRGASTPGPRTGARR
jgi:hypothetical protein